MRRQRAVEKEWILNNGIENFIVKEVSELSLNQACWLSELLKNGCESAYIARYRGDVHGGLPPEKIRKAMDAYFEAIDLNKKVSSAISTITAKIAGVREKRDVTERLKECADIGEVSDISKEFAIGTRKTKASIARELGLEPHAQSILQEKFVDLKDLLSKDLKTVCAVEENLKICLADLINRDPETRKIAMQIMRFKIRCHLKVIANLTRDAAKNKEQLERNNSLRNYRNLIGLERNAETIQNHTVSALIKGANDNLISWKVAGNFNNVKSLHPFFGKRVNGAMRSLFEKAFSYSITTYFIPMIERGTKKYLTECAQNRAVEVFGKNVEQLFTREGIRGRFVIALDPGKLIKTAFIEPSGKVKAMGQFSIRESTFDKQGIELIKSWSSQTMGKNIVFAVGNGSNTYNTQSAVAKMINANEFPKGIDVSFCVVPEDGASKYSCTSAAQEEFGVEAKIQQISAVSIGRRLIDPMSEYVKIEPQHLGKGQYQSSVDEKLLKAKLEAVIRDIVSQLGVDLNTASRRLLQNICGLNQATAAEIVAYREKNGRFKSRQELKKVEGIGEITFQQCAGFLTVSNLDVDSDGPPAKRFKESGNSFAWSPLDETIVHPDDYEVATLLLKKLKMDIKYVASGAQVPSINLTEKEQRVFNLLKSKPKMKPPPSMLKEVRLFKDLAPNQRFTGRVANKTDFGIFIDIGVEKDGMLHISHFRDAKRSDKPRQNLDDVETPNVNDEIEVVINGINGDRIDLRLA